MKDAFVTIAVNDLRGTREGIVLDWGGTNRPLLPGSQVPGYTTGATTPRDKSITKKILSYHRIPVPEFHVFRMGHAVVRPKKLKS